MAATVAGLRGLAARVTRGAASVAGWLVLDSLVAIADLLDSHETRLMPEGGTTGEVLTKTSADDYDADWQAAAAGYSDEQAQDAVGGIFSNPPVAGGVDLFYSDATPSITANVQDGAITLLKLADGTAGEILTWDAGGVPDTVAVGTATHVLTSNGAGLPPTFQAAVVPKRVVGATFDGGGSTPTVGTVGYVVCPYAGTIDRWYIVADASGSAVVDVWKAAGAIPINANTIAGSEKPTLSAQQLANDTALGTWTTAVAVGDVFGFELESVATCTRVTVEVRIQEAA